MKSIRKNLVGSFPSKGPSSTQSVAAHALIPTHFPRIIPHANLLFWYIINHSSRGASRPTRTRQSHRRTRATAQVVLALHHRPQITQNQARLVQVPTSNISSVLRTQIRPSPHPLSEGPLLLAVQVWDPAHKTKDTEIRKGLLLPLLLSVRRCHRIPSRIQDRSTSWEMAIPPHRVPPRPSITGYGLRQKIPFQ